MSSRSNIDIKILRLQPPINLISHTPLSGAYNDITIKEDLTTYPLQSKLKHFDISNPQFPGYLNMFAINKSFGKAIYGDMFTSLIIFYNQHPTQYTKISVPKIMKKLDNNENTVNYIHLPSNEKYGQIREKTMNPHDIEIIKLNEQINRYCKYYFNLTFNTNLFDIVREGNKEKKTNYKSLSLSKSFCFECYEPFTIKEKFHNVQMERWCIELRVENKSKTTLMIKNIELFSEMKKDNNTFLCLSDTTNTNILLQPDEMFNYLLSTDNSNGFLSSPSLSVAVNWRSMFNPQLKVAKRIIKNEFYNVDNNYFKLKVSEMPSTVQIGNVFKVIFELVNKTTNTLLLTIDYDKHSEYDVIQDRCVEIIDIVDKHVEINKNENNTNKFCVICKSNVVGNVALPPLVIKFNSKNQFVYNKLLNFDCTEEVNLLI